MWSKEVQAPKWPKSVLTNEGKIVREAQPKVMQPLVVSTDEAESQLETNSLKLARQAEEEKKKDKKTRPVALGKMSFGFMIISKNPRYVKFENK